MDSRIAASSPPMKLHEREALAAKQIRFLISPLPSIFIASATQVLTKALLKAFINKLLSTLILENPLTEIPTADRWGLKGNEEGFLALENWDPRDTNQDVYKVVALPGLGNPRILTAIYPRWAVLEAGSWPQTSRVKSLPLPNEEIFQIAESHLLIVINYKVKVKIQRKARGYRTEEHQTSILIPANMAVVDLVREIKPTGNLAAVYKLPEMYHDLQGNTRTPKELAWTHGTRLSFEMM